MYTLIETKPAHEKNILLQKKLKHKLRKKTSSLEKNQKGSYILNWMEHICRLQFLLAGTALRFRYLRLNGKRKVIKIKSLSLFLLLCLKEQKKNTFYRVFCLFALCMSLASIGTFAHYQRAQLRN